MSDSQVWWPERGQNMCAVHSAHWFTLSEELQGAAQHVIDMLSDSKDAIGIVAVEVDMQDDEYSRNIYFKVGSRRYSLYKRDGIFRIGAGGNNLARGCLADQMSIESYFRDRMG